MNVASDAPLRDAVQAILHRHGLDAPSAPRYDSGSLPVFAIGAGHVLKLYPP